MDGIRKIARAYYERASENEKNTAKAFFKKLDANGDGKISLQEFKASSSSWLNDEKLFKQLDVNGNGTLDFHEALALYYMAEKVIIPRCDGCRELLVGPYFSCLPCQAKDPDTCDLCCACYHGGKFKHEHAPSKFLDHHALLMMFRERTTDAQKKQVKREMEELREIARAHYRAGSSEVQSLAHSFFDSLDTDGDKRVDLPEFLSFMRQEGYANMRNPHFFKELDRDGNGTLDFWEVMTLYYIIKSGRPFCDWCGDFIPGIFFSCVECYKRSDSAFSLCRNCYRSSKCNHSHNGKAQFLDNYTLLEAQRDSTMAQASGVNRTETRTTTRGTNTRSPIPHNAIVPAASYGNTYINNTGPTYHTYFVNPSTSSPRPNYSTAIVPASRANKWKVALRAFEFGLGIGSISTTLCSIFIRGSERVFCFKERKLYTKPTKKHKQLKVSIDEKDYAHVIWWKERMQMCRKPSSVLLVQRLTFSNLLGVDATLKNGSLKEGTLNWEILQFKSKFPREVLLCRVGDFYEAIGVDACILVEYAGLNPFGGLRSDSIPRAGCPVVNLRQTLDDLTRNGFSVCIVEEVQGPAQARTRKSRFISGHAHPGSPYVFGLVGDDHDLDFPDPMPVVGISRSAKGYCMVSVLETMKTYSAEDNLTEEALVTKLRTCRCHHLFLHSSLRHNSSGTCRWGEFGEGGLLWGECSARQFEWFDGNPVNELLYKVKELYGLEDDITFRNVTVAPENRPSPLHLGTATQIGALPTEGIPCLLRVLLPSNCTGLPVMYVRDLLLNPPAYEIASTIQEACKLMSNTTCSIPEFTCVPPAKLVKLLESRETNHIEFCKIKNVLDEIIQLYTNPELNEILNLLVDPTWVATGLKVELETLVNECKSVSHRIGEIISFDGETDQKITSRTIIPNDFFDDMESSWKGRVKRIHLEEEFAEVDEAAKALSVAIEEDFVPIIRRIRAMTSPLGGPKGEILYAREHEAVWFKGKRFVPSVWAGTPGEEQIKQLRPAFDSKGKKVGEEWFTTVKVDDALARYHEAGDKAKAKVMELLRGLSAELQTNINILVFASMLLVIAKALFGHVSEGRRRKWVFPTLTQRHSSEDNGILHGAGGMNITGLSPYWFDAAQGGAVKNDIDMNSLFLLTGPNGGGKSSLLRSICAAALLGICGFMVPAEAAIIPHFDSIMLHMKSYDSPADGKSSFQVEMSEVRSIIARATSKSLVLIDEICRGTETAKGTCIAGSIIETLDATSCLGIVSTHLHGIFDLPLRTKNAVFKAMGAELINNQTMPTWKLIDGICRESLAFETAQREGVPEELIQRAEELYVSVYAKDLLRTDESKSKHNSYKERSSEVRSVGPVEILCKEVEIAVINICQKRMIDLCKNNGILAPSGMRCVLIGAKEQPPPSTIGASSVYVMLRPDRKLYVGETDDLQGRVRAHRLKEGMQNASFIYFLVPGKSMACQLETVLINQLPSQGFRLSNLADGKHRNFGTSDHFETEMLAR